MKLWLATQIIRFFYAVLYWAHTQKMESEQEQFIFIPLTTEKPQEKRTMN